MFVVVFLKPSLVLHSIPEFKLDIPLRIDIRGTDRKTMPPWQVDGISNVNPLIKARCRWRLGAIYQCELRELNIIHVLKETMRDKRTYIYAHNYCKP